MGDHQKWPPELSADDRRRGQQILTSLSRLGCDDPQGWATSEVTENIPQLARYRFLHSIWPSFIDSWRNGIMNIPAAQRAVDSGASPDEVTRLARAVAYETAFAMLNHLQDEEQPEGMPSWVLAEVSPAGDLTGRALDALHEDLLTLDPSGRDGQDLWS